MKRILYSVLTIFSGLAFSSVALAEDAAAGGLTSGNGLLAIGAALAIGLAAMGGTLAQGRAAAAALDGISRNPSSADKVFTPMLLGLALIEFQAIMGFIVAYLVVSKL